MLNTISAPNDTYTGELIEFIQALRDKGINGDSDYKRDKGRYEILSVRFNADDLSELVILMRDKRHSEPMIQLRWKPLYAKG